MLHFRKIPKKNGEIWRKFSKIWPNLGKFAKFWKKTAKNSAIFNENFEIRERCKGVHCVDLGESFPTSIYLQNLASIQPRTSLVKFARSPRTDPPGPRTGSRAPTDGIRSLGTCLVLAGRQRDAWSREVAESGRRPSGAAS